MLRTMMYSGETVHDGLRSVVTCMGNPLVWWAGFVCLISLIVRWFKQRDLSIGVIIIGFLSVYCPWMFVLRSTFIYHYFTSIPCLVLSIVAVMDLLNKKFNKSIVVWGHEVALVHAGSFIFVGLCLALFVMFLPVLIGIPVSQGYIDMLKWFPGWAM